MKDTERGRAARDDWRLVPVAPTPEMVKAGERAHWGKLRDMMSPMPTEFYDECGGPMGYAWIAMVNAAPAQAEPTVRAEFECATNGVTGTASVPVKRVEREDDGTLTAVLDYWPAPAAQPQPQPQPQPVNAALVAALRGCAQALDWLAHGCARGWSDHLPTSAAALATARAALADADAAQPVALTFGDAVRIASGCTDYGGGYRGTQEFQAYQDGINTVIAVLKAASRRGVEDTQVAALHRIGADLAAADAAQPVALTDERIDELLIDLDEIARDFDHYEYGLPLHAGEEKNRMRAAVRSRIGITAGTEGDA